MDNVKHRLCIADIILIVAIVLLTAVALLTRIVSAGDGTVCTVRTPDGTWQYPLSEARTIDITSCGIELRIEISDGSAAVTKSTCPDGICMKTGAVSRPGEAVICVPAQLSITVSGGGEADADAVIS